MGQTFKLIDVGNGEEVLREVNFKDIKLGDILILRDTEGNLIRENGSCMFQAISDSYLDNNNKYRIAYCVFDTNSIYIK